MSDHSDEYIAQLESQLSLYKKLLARCEGDVDELKSLNAQASDALQRAHLAEGEAIQQASFAAASVLALVSVAAFLSCYGLMVVLLGASTIPEFVLYGILALLLAIIATSAVIGLFRLNILQSLLIRGKLLQAISLGMAAYLLLFSVIGCLLFGGQPKKENTWINLPATSTATATPDPSALMSHTYYWTPSGSRAHYSRSCSTLSNSKNILSGDLEHAFSGNVTASCSVCCPDAIVFYVEGEHTYHKDTTCGHLSRPAGTVYYATYCQAVGLGISSPCDVCA